MINNTMKLTFTTIFAMILMHSSHSYSVINTGTGPNLFSEDTEIQLAYHIQTAPTLKSAMKNMGTNLKLIIAQISDPAQNIANAQLADNFVLSAKDSKTFIPDSIRMLPSDQQQARIDLYYQMLDKSIELGTRLSSALRAGDNSSAQSIVDELLKNKKEGHYEFN